jgi:hypothetical protein
MRIAALLLPIAFVMVSVATSNHRLSSHTVKTSAKLAAYCALAAVLFAVTFAPNNEVSVPSTSSNSKSSSSTHRTVAAFVQHVYRHSRSAASSSGVILERNKLRLQAPFPNNPGSAEDLILRAALDEWFLTTDADRSLHTPTSACRYDSCDGDDDILLTAFSELSAATSLLSSPLRSASGTPRTSPASSPAILPQHELSSMSSPLGLSASASVSPPPELGPRVKLWRHNPYTVRSFTLLDADTNHHLVPIVIGNGADKHVHNVRFDVLLKPTQPPIDLRRRGKIPPETTACKPQQPNVTASKTETHQQAKASNPEAAASRKNFKRDCEVSKVAIHEPLYSIVTNMPRLAQVPATWVSTIDEGWTTLTGLPNADGYRVAELLLRHYADAGVIRSGYQLSNDVRRLDRFNTGACHVVFNEVEDARRLQLQLRADLIFATFRAGQCVVSAATE